MIDNSQSKRVLARTFAQHFEEKMLLREGLMVSYGSSSLKAALFGSFKDFIAAVEDVPLFQTKKPYKFGVPNTVTILIKNPKVFKAHYKKLNEILNQQGYTKTIHKETDSGFDLYQFEPKYPVAITKEELKQFRIFHIAEGDRVHKILKTGLNPKDSRTKFKHAGNRIYLFATLNPAQDIPALAKKLSERRIKQNDKIVSKKMVALEVDPEGIKEDELYLDESFEFKPNQYYAIFTLYSIRPEYLKTF